MQALTGIGIALAIVILLIVGYFLLDVLVSLAQSNGCVIFLLALMGIVGIVLIVLGFTTNNDGSAPEAGVGFVLALIGWGILLLIFFFNRRK